jgi:hypothetical protein
VSAICPARRAAAAARAARAVRSAAIGDPGS